MPNWTPTQYRLLQVFSDGYLHSKEELHGCLNEELSEPNNLRVHLTKLREKLRPIGEDIICIKTDGITRYRHVRIVSINE
jgi:DNA-binding winged helix-turn-helix (wHTH) protein